MKVIVNTITQAAVLAAGVVAGPLRFQLLDSTGKVSASQDVPTGTSAEFDSVADGSYTAVVQRLDSTGAALGGAISQAFAVATPAPVAVPAGATPAPATYDAPASLTVTVQ